MPQIPTPVRPPAPAARPATTPPSAAERPAEKAAACLNNRQQTALHALVAGKSIRVAARICGADRGTVSQWVREDPNFRAALGVWRQELADSARAALLETSQFAVVALRRAIQKGDGRLALALLDRLGLSGPLGGCATDPKQAANEVAVEEYEALRQLQGRFQNAYATPFYSSSAEKFKEMHARVCERANKLPKDTDRSATLQE